MFLGLVAAWPRPLVAKTVSPSTAATRAFAEGQKLYRNGRFREAIVAFTRAQKLAPLASTLFNLARCHENLSEPGQAIGYYHAALRLTTVAQQVLDIRERISRLKRLPSRVFVSSDPPGAEVWVDGAAKAAGRTPAVLKLRAGPHVVILRHPQFEPAIKRFDVIVGKERTVHLALQRRAKVAAGPCSLPASAPSAPCSRCRDPRLIDFEGTHVHFTLLGGFMLATELGAVGGGGGQVAVTIDRWRFGGYIQYMPVNPSDIGALAGTDTSTSFTMALLDVGWVFPFGRWQLSTTLGVGGYFYRLTYDTSATDAASFVRQSRGVMWSLSAGVEAMITSWLSLGIGLRLGMMHGDMMQPKVVEVQVAGSPQYELDPSEESGHFPYATLWGGVNFHL